MTKKLEQDFFFTLIQNETSAWCILFSNADADQVSSENQN